MGIGQRRAGARACAWRGAETWGGAVAGVGAARGGPAVQAAAVTGEQHPCTSGPGTPAPPPRSPRRRRAVRRAARGGGGGARRSATARPGGSGEVESVRRPERVVWTAGMIVGSTWFAYLVGAIAALVNSHGAAAIRRAACREKMIALRCFLDRHPSVPKTLRTRLVTFFSDTWIRKMKTNNDRALLNDLPEALRRETRFRALEGDLRLAFGGKAATAQNKESEEDAGEEDGKRGQVSEEALRAVADALVCRIVSPGTKFHIASTFVMVNEGELVVTLGGGFDFESPATPGLVTRRATNSLLEASVKSGDSRDRFVVCRGTARAHSIGVEAFCSPLDRVAARRTQNVLSCVASSETEVYEMDAARAARLGGEFPDLRKGAVVALGLVDPETNRNDSLT